MIMGSKSRAHRRFSNTGTPHEQEVIARIVEKTKAKLLEGHKPGEPLHRDAHPKSHGCVKAKFIVSANLPDALRVGVFESARSFDAWIRFSNGAPSAAPDKRPDVRGFAIKLLGVTGQKVLEDEACATTQDFVLCNHHSFFVKDAEDYVSFVTNFMDIKPVKYLFPSRNPFTWKWRELFTTGPIAFVFPSLNPFSWRLREVWNLANGMLKKIPSPSEIRYWSQTPYQLGDNAVKYSVIPTAVPVVPDLPESDNRLRGMLVQQLRKGSVVFDFMVQLQGSPWSMPIEDPRIRWSEKKSPFIKVATIVIPAQEFDTPARREFDENLSFTPWHTGVDQVPLGGINRARRAVYQAISTLRHRMNGVPRVEPTEDSLTES